ncbi:DICT sensory domain-containing protein [Haloarchaeobius sp. HME9146]|uniref:DICT sensory domain-containing protein n=1 Tax=Haloarchaeobius sp. HME9146 TaxID=2978732 RepID=UPI0021BFF0B6|nr:DICT sensory domain-containing protein [Haloarchaeobius sp. HME9146]MCT9098392.1 histidine kinase [Haloarchaeobius sp. HME9146]
MSLLEFIHDLGETDRTLTVVNRTEVDLVQDMLEDLFEDQPVRVTESTDETDPTSDRVLVDGEQVDGAQVESGDTGFSSLNSIGNAVLFVNSDTYISGSRTIDEIETPDALVALADTPFSVVGYPDTRKQKFLLIEMSRYIEARAWRAGAGTVHSGFQKLSRINDERGTRDVYDKLASTALDVHIYGVPDWSPEPESSIHAHGTAGDEELLRSWFVIYEHPTDPTENTALVCYETGRNEWEGFWTFDSERVADVSDYVATRFQYDTQSAG